MAVALYNNERANGCNLVWLWPQGQIFSLDLGREVGFYKFVSSDCNVTAVYR